MGPELGLKKDAHHKEFTFILDRFQWELFPKDIVVLFSSARFFP